jgi:GTPase SAR1 family protein
MLPGNRSVPAILVCNKSDLPRDNRLPDDVDISRYVLEHGFAPKWFKTSAKTGQNVEATLSLIVRYMNILKQTPTKLFSVLIYACGLV